MDGFFNDDSSDFPPHSNRKHSRPRHRKLQKLPPWRVVLLDDPKYPIKQTVSAITDLTKLTPTAATQCLNEAHQSGHSTLLVTHQERAELYYCQFFQRNLNVSIEPNT